MSSVRISPNLGKPVRLPLVNKFLAIMSHLKLKIIHILNIILKLNQTNLQRTYAMKLKKFQVIKMKKLLRMLYHSPRATPTL